MFSRSQAGITTLTFFLMLLLWVGHGLAWVGFELDASVVGVSDTWETAGGDGGLWELDGRVMAQGSVAALDLEFHWLATAAGALGDRELTRIEGTSPFRALDMEKVHEETSRRVLASEVDRLTLGWSSDSVAVTLGRQAVTWGEAYYFNIGDLFGAFPITETNRLYKPGIDALSVKAGLGPFTDLFLVSAPSGDTTDSVAANLVTPAGPLSLSFTAGRILEADKVGAGCTMDVGGAKIYGSFLQTREEGGDRFSEAVVGAEKQVGPYTRMVGEAYYNGWGADDPDRYPALMLSGRYLSGQTLTLGRYNGVIQVSRQLTPLFTFTPAFFANFSDGSVLAQLDGGWSLSDLTSLTGGVLAGFGKRPSGGLPESEYGGWPLTVYVEVVHSI